MSSSLVLLLALHVPSAAFAPDGPSFQGIEPQRLQVVHPTVQAGLSAGDAWQDFLATEGPGWSVTWDESLGAPRRLRGPGVPAPTEADALGAWLIDWLEGHHALLGIEPNTLRVTNAKYAADTDTWFVDLQVPVAGLPVWRGGISARVKHGRLVDVAVATYPGVPVTGAEVLSADAATGRAISGGAAPAAVHTGLDAQRILLPIESLGGLELRHAWVVRSRTASPVGQWVAFVDAETGEVLNVHNEIRFFDGQVLGEHDLRNPYDLELVVDPLPLAELTSAYGEVVFSETDGTFTFLADPGEITTDLKGSYAKVYNDDGDDAVLATAGPEVFWTEPDATLAEIDAYVFLHQVRSWGSGAAPLNGMVQGPVTAHVNLDMSCNAYFDGNVNFFRAGQGCNNTGRIADVVYHEWGHGLHYYQLSSYLLGFDGSLGEGAADTVSFLITGDHRIAPGFFTGGSPIRDQDNNARYPDDFVMSDYYVHSNGLIFGGSMWDLWGLLTDLEGTELGTGSTEAIFTGLLEGGPDIATSYDEAILADDDDGDLANGTPHECEIVEAFGLHGLGPLGGSGSPYVAFHVPVTDTVAEVEVPVRFDLSSVAPNCFPYAPESGVLHYQVDDGPWAEVPLTIDPAGAEAAIPGQPEGALVSYWIEVEDEAGGTFLGPAGGEINPYTYYSGGLIEVHCDDFEDSDGGYDHRLVDGTPDDGADDWQWGKPAGLSGDPSTGESGKKVWGNDLGQDNFNGAYQDLKHNRLRSPEFDLDHYQGVLLRYDRWLNIEDGLYDQAWIEADGETVWSNYVDDGDAHHLDQGWASHVVALGSSVEDGLVELQWHLQSDGGVGFGGWTLDDVCLMAPATPDNRLGISDFDASVGAGGSVSLTWTNPKHDPVVEVAVVRKVGGYPTAFWDGELVYRDQAPVAGASVAVEDPRNAGGNYAVYAFDGTDWLSWTIEGFNADVAGSAAGGDAADSSDASDDGGAAGCGCASAPGPLLGGGGTWLGLLLVPFLRRRRA